MENRLDTINIVIIIPDRLKRINLSIQHENI